ncbi:MAG: hypothetical protein CMO63_05615 [Verrucomicrobiales bacterium]|nr:hypothetical protein [Verrucomicrobiales bacterium]
MLPPAVMQTTQKTILNLFAPGITLCLIALLAGCTPPERTALEEGSRLLAAGKAQAALVELNNAFEFISKNDELKRSPKIMGHLHNQLGLAHQELYRDNSKTNHYFKAYQAYRFTTTNQNTPTTLKQRAHQNLAWLYLERYHWNSNLAAFRANAGKAADEYNKLRIEVGDDKFEQWLEKGVAEFHSGQYTAARESFRKAGRQDATALNALGILAAVENRHEAAAQYFEEASGVDAENPQLKLHLAIALQSMEQYQSALEAYQAYLSATPDSAAKKEQVKTLVTELEEYLKPEPKPEPKEEPVEEKPEEVAVVEPIEPERPKEEEKPEAKPVEVAVKEEPEEAVAPTEPKEENPTEPEVAVVPAEVKQQEPKEAPEEAPVEEPITEPAEVVIVEPPSVEPTEVIAVEPVEPKEELPVPVAKPEETVVPEEAPAEPESGTEVAVEEPPVKPAEVIEPAEPDEEATPKKKWTDRLNPARWFGGRNKDKADGQVNWKSRTPLPTIPTPKPVAPASTNATARVVNVLPTAVAYPRYAYLHPALPKAGDRQVAKTYFDDGAKAQKRKEWQRAKAAYLQASKSDPAWFEAQCELGQAAYYTGETGLALQAFENALAIDPNDGPARFNFAMSLKQGTYYADAAKELETYLQFDPNSVRAHLEAANLYAERLHDVAKAAIHYKRVIGLKPEHPQAVDIRYWLIRNKAN